jgi:hypothetical protein
MVVNMVEIDFTACRGVIGDCALAGSYSKTNAALSSVHNSKRHEGEARGTGS